MLGQLRRESDLAIAIVHSGLSGAASYDTTGVGGEHAAAALAGVSEPPDLVVVGHSHREMRDTVIGGVHFVQPRPFGGSVSVTHISLVRQAGRWRRVRVAAELVPTAGVSPSARINQRLASEQIDVTLPARPEPQGKIHPVTQVIEEITAWQSRPLERCYPVVIFDALRVHHEKLPPEFPAPVSRWF